MLDEKEINLTTLQYLSKFYPIKRIYHQCKMENLFLIFKYGFLENIKSDPSNRHHKRFKTEFPHDNNFRYFCKPHDFFWGSNEPYLIMENYQNHFDGMLSFFPPKQTLIFKSVPLHETVSEEERTRIIDILYAFYSKYYKLENSDRGKIDNSLHSIDYFKSLSHAQYDYYIYFMRDCKLQMDNILDITIYSIQKYNEFVELLKNNGFTRYISKIKVKNIDYYTK